MRLSTISDEARRPEDEFWAEFEAVRPHILGAALDAVSTALRNIGSVRLADFVKWVIAAVPVLGFEPGDFETAYRENRRDVSESSFESDPFAVALVEFVETKHPISGFTGTATELHKALKLHVRRQFGNPDSGPAQFRASGRAYVAWRHCCATKDLPSTIGISGERLITIIPPRRLVRDWSCGP